MNDQYGGPPWPRAEASEASGALLDILDAEPAFQDAAPRLVEALGDRLGWDVASLWIPNPRSRRLRCTAFWARERARVKEFERATLEARYAEGEGLAGRAWRSGVPVWTTSPAADPRLAPDASDPALTTFVAFPLATDDHFVGVIELAAREPREIDVGLQRTLVALGYDVGTALDRRLAEEAAGAERARLEVALAAGRMGIWDWDLATNRLRWSETLERMCGIEPGTFGGRVEDYVAVIHPDDRDWVIGAFLQAFERGGDRHIFLEHRLERGPEEPMGWLQIRGRALLDPVGQVTSLTGVAIDITDRVDREQRARLERAILDLVSEVSGIATWEWDLTRGLARWSPELVALVGDHSIDPGHVTPEDVLRTLHPDDRWVVDETIRAAAELRDFHVAYRVIGADGTEHHLESWGRPVHDAAGECTGLAGITVPRPPAD